MVQPTTEDNLSKLILVSRVLYTPVYSKDGSLLDQVDDIPIERESSRSMYGVLASGGFLGIGARFHPVPCKLLDYDPERGGLSVPIGKEELEAASALRSLKAGAVLALRRRAYDCRDS